MALNGSRAASRLWSQRLTILNRSNNGFSIRRLKSNSIVTIRTQNIAPHSQIRFYSIRDRYIWRKSEQEIQEQAKEEAELARKKEAAAEKKKKEQEKADRLAHLLPKSGIQPAPENVRYLSLDLANFKQPKSPKGVSIAIIGPPNAGKSTLLNRIMGTKVSIVSKKAQTTREQVNAVYTSGDTQIFFVDTPGIVTSQHKAVVSRDVSTAAWAALDGVELVFVMVDAVKTVDSDLKYFFAKLKEYKLNFKKKTDMDKEIVLMLNKSDLLEEMSSEERPPFPAPDRFRHHFQDLDEIFSKVITISALTGDNVSKVLSIAQSKAVDRPWVFPESVVRLAFLKTDQPPLKIAHEVIREKIFRRLNNEIPYQVYQENEGWTELTNGSLRIDQLLIVTKKSQQAILVGTKGENIAGIRLEAARDLATIFNRKVWLQLRVVVRDQLPEDATISEPLIA